LIIFLLIFSLSITISSQVNQSKLDTTSQTEKSYKSKKNLFVKYLINDVSDYDSLKIALKVYSFLLDSLKTLKELILTDKMDLGQSTDLSIWPQIFNNQRQIEFLLLTSKEYYKNQPKYNLGAVGKYLKVSNKVAAIILALLSL